MAYNKPQVLAQNGTQGVFAAGCPTAKVSGNLGCKACETKI